MFNDDGTVSIDGDDSVGCVLMVSVTRGYLGELGRWGRLQHCAVGFCGSVWDSNSVFRNSGTEMDCVGADCSVWRFELSLLVPRSDIVGALAEDAAGDE